MITDKFGKTNYGMIDHNIHIHKQKPHWNCQSCSKWFPSDSPKKGKSICWECKKMKIKIRKLGVPKKL